MGFRVATTHPTVFCHVQRTALFAMSVRSSFGSNALPFKV